jgi:ABC-type multidrug transport system fused ATPase/permease subunit
MRIIKLLSWESQFATDIADVRSTETRILWRRQLMRTLLFIISRGNSTIAACIALGFYAIVQEQQLTATADFTTLLVFDMMKDKLGELLNTSYWVMNFRDSNRRITTFLETPNAPPTYESIDQDRRDNVNRIGFVDAVFCWPTNSSKSDQVAQGHETEWSDFTLTDLNINFKPKEFNMISGPSSNGKTSLLLALIGGM